MRGNPLAMLIGIAPKAQTLVEVRGCLLNGDRVAGACAVLQAPDQAVGLVPK